MKWNKILLAAAFSLLLTACKSKKDSGDAILPARLLYNQGLELLEAGKFKKASEEFEKVYFQHPGASITPQAELMEAYSLYLAGKYEDAVDVLENFIKIHPMNIDIAYAYYLKGLSEYMQISRAQLDQSATARAKDAFGELISRFPNSKYALDATLKMDLIEDHLAGGEMEVARYYLDTNNPIAALPRLQNVLRNYSTTSHVAEVLYRLSEACMMLGLKEDAQKYAAVLGYNHNHSIWYKRAYHMIHGRKQKRI